VRSGLAALLLLSCATPAVLPPSSASPLLDQPTPSLEGAELVSRELPADLSGKVIVLEFFARYCAPCQPKLDEAEAVHRDLGDAQFIGISLDESPTAAMAQIHRHHLSFPVLHDPDLKISSRFRVSDLPMTVILNREGRVLWVGGPDQPPNTLREAVRAALEIHPASAR
jgi:peroxiredoxin